MITRERYYGAQHMLRDDSYLFNKFADDELKSLMIKLANQRRDPLNERVKFSIALSRLGWSKSRIARRLIKMQRGW